MDRLNKMMERVKKFYWSPEPPENYQCLGLGIGSVAGQCYGTFNLIWAIYDGDFSGGRIGAAQDSFRLAKPCMGTLIDGHPLSSWLTLLTEQEFTDWYRHEGKDRVGGLTKEWLDLGFCRAEPQLC